MDDFKLFSRFKKNRNGKMGRLILGIPEKRFYINSMTDLCQIIFCSL